MTRKRAKKMLEPFMKKCGKDSDPYYLVHFSRVDDYYSGFEEGLDFLDATIIARQLVKSFPELKIYFYDDTTKQA